MDTRLTHGLHHLAMAYIHILLISTIQTMAAISITSLVQPITITFTLAHINHGEIVFLVQVELQLHLTTTPLQQPVFSSIPLILLPLLDIIAHFL